MIFKPFRYEPLGQVSYLLGCGRAREAFVVDPNADLGPDHYVVEAADLGLTITGVLETHVHADYRSCARELAELAAAPHHLFHAAPVRYTFTPLTDRQVLRLGKVELTVLHTPGHTPEHVALLVTDTGRSLDPWFVLTADSLFVGDVGRPDLLLGDQAVDVADEAERARTQFRSITSRLFTLPDQVEVYPGHYGVSACGGVNMSGKASSTIGFEKRYNLPMQQVDADGFARFVRQTARPLPADYERIKAHNLGLARIEAAAPRGSG
jgi:hydroxyacylglutathione hydrolase